MTKRYLFAFYGQNDTLLIKKDTPSCVIVNLYDSIFVYTLINKDFHEKDFPYYSHFLNGFVVG